MRNIIKRENWDIHKFITVKDWPVQSGGEQALCLPLRVGERTKFIRHRGARAVPVRLLSEVIRMVTAGCRERRRAALVRND